MIRHNASSMKSLNTHPAYQAFSWTNHLREVGTAVSWTARKWMWQAFCAQTAIGLTSSGHCESDIWCTYLLSLLTTLELNHKLMQYCMHSYTVSDKELVVTGVWKRGVSEQSGVWPLPWKEALWVRGERRPCPWHSVTTIVLSLGRKPTATAIAWAWASLRPSAIRLKLDDVSWPMQPRRNEPPPTPRGTLRGGGVGGVSSGLYSSCRLEARLWC